MTTEEKKAKILAAIASRGWCFKEVYLSAGLELAAAGLVKQSDKYVLGGNRRAVWVAA
jgi:hypothetical protein